MRDRISNESYWQSLHEQGSEFGYENKIVEVSPIINQLFEEGKLGKVIADLGSGSKALSDIIPESDAKIVKIDFAVPENKTDSQIQKNINLEQAVEPSWGTKKSLLEIRQWLEQNGVQTEDGPMADTIILSDVINYIDYRRVMPAIVQYLKVGGRMIILNMPNRGYFRVFPDQEKRLQSNLELIYLLRENGMEMEKLTFNGQDFSQAKDVDLRDISQGIMFYVAVRKEKVQDINGIEKQEG